MIAPLCLGIMPAWAGKVTLENYRGAWGVSSFPKCGAHDSTIACIDGYNGCGNWDTSNKMGTIKNRGTEADEGALLVLVAREVNEYGAKFCVTQLQGANEDGNKNNSKPWTEIYEPAGAQRDCFWLCQSGHHGVDCKATQASSCDSKTSLKTATFSKYSLLTDTSYTNIENDIPMFYANEYKDCSNNHKEEHDMILMITKWAPNGHGAFVAPTVFRAESAIDKNGIKKTKVQSTAALTPVPKTETLLCLNGYAPNADGSDCVEVNTTLCQAGNLCPAFSTGYDATKHKILSTLTADSCYEYRCSDPNEAFRQGTHTCTECVQTATRGMLESSGECVTCAEGQIFDASATGGCVAATAYSMDVLKYGPGKGETTLVTEQCWTHGSDYKECVRGEKVAE